MSAHQDEDTQPGRRRQRSTTETDLDRIAAGLDLDAPAGLASGSQAALEVADTGAHLPEPNRRAPFVADCWLGDQHIAVETDGAAVSLVLLKAMKLVATPAEALTLANALLRAVALVRR